MRILFFGTATFAVASLKALLDRREHEIIGVVTQPDRARGRGGKFATSPVKDFAVERDLAIYQPEKVRTKEFRQVVRDLAPDVFVVAAFGQIISQRMLDIPPFGGINVHGSLLPRWRGAAPIQYALMCGDAQTGVTTMQMDAGLDTGDMLLAGALPLMDEDNYGTVEEKLAVIGADLLIDTLTRLQDGNCPREPQDADLVTLAPALPPDVGQFDWTRSAVDLHNLTRGVTPKPGAYTLFGGKRLKILRTAVAMAHHPQAGNENVLLEACLPGEIESVGRDGITVSTGEGTLRLIEVQPESKGSMPADAWARGARLTTGQTFDLLPAGSGKAELINGCAG